MRTLYLATAFVLVLTVSVLGFRGSPFTHPPMDVFPEWLFPGMKYQPKYKPQGASAFFADGRADRPPPPGVIPADFGPLGQPLHEDDHLYRGKNPDGTWARGFPAGIAVDMRLLERGRDRFTIYCAPCHGRVGDGNGITKRYGMVATPSYHDDRLRKRGGRDGRVGMKQRDATAARTHLQQREQVRFRWTPVDPLEGNECGSARLGGSVQNIDESCCVGNEVAACRLQPSKQLTRLQE